MATKDLPIELRVGAMDWGSQKAGVQFSGPLNGTLQGVDFMAERFVASITFNPRRRELAGAVEVFGSWLAGGVNRVRMWHLSRPVPLGTMRGLPKVISAPFGSLSVALQTSAGATLEPGDLFKPGDQLMQATERCIANSAGVLVVPVLHHVRAAIPADTTVEWDQPTTLMCAPATSSRLGYVPAVSDRLQIELTEVW